MEQGMTALDRMNQILTEKETAIENKRKKLESYEKQLVSYKKDLEAFEKDLYVKTKELQERQMKLQEEETRISARWEELKLYENNLEHSMNEVLEEKVKLELKNKELFLEELGSTDTDELIFGSLNLNEMRESIGIVVTQKEEVELDIGPTVKKEEVESEAVSLVQKENQESDVVSLVEDVPNFGTQSEPENIFKGFQEVIEKKYSRWTMLEQTEDMYCLQIAKQRELRIFAGKLPLMELQIVIFHKNANVDKKLSITNTAISRVTPDWGLKCEETHYAWCYRFTKDTAPETVLKICNDFIKKHL